MKKLFSRFVPLSLLISLLLALIPVPAYAASVTAVNPVDIASGVATVITVTGDGFDATAKVLLDGAELPGTVVIDANTLKVTVPADASVGAHIVTVAVAGAVVNGSAQINVYVPAPPVPTATATTAPLPFTRPQFVVKSTKISGSVSTNESFKLTFVIENAGTSTAYSVQAVFSGADVVPLKNGGIAAAGTVDADNQVNIPQSFQVTGQIWGKTLLPIDVTVTYYDEKGTSYSDKFTLSIPTTNGGGSGIVYPTATPTNVKTSQLVIPSYAVSVNPLEPGLQFTLTMTVQNVGNLRAQRVTMIVGGGSSGSVSLTPQPGGVSGGSGEFTNFAPVGASNVQSLGDLAAGDMIQATQNLIVNVSTNPGAYPMKVTFSYLNDKNESVNDEQVITLLVYSLPKVDVSFYRPPDPFFVGQPGALPVQVVNTGKRAVVLGNLQLESEEGTIENGKGLIGSIDAGGYFTLDSMFTPEKSGPIVLNVTIDYTDDFNQARTVTKTLKIDVTEGMPEQPGVDPNVQPGIEGIGGEVPPPVEETFLQKAWRFVLGIFGLDSAPPSGGDQVTPPIEEPAAPQIKPSGGKGG
jgi:hypothetical protein